MAFKKLLIILLSFVVFVLAFFFIGWPKDYPKEYGVTWSSPYAWSLGLNPTDGLRLVLDDLGVRRFRIPAYWTDIERERGTYDFHIVKEQLDAIAKRNGTVMLAIGSRLPRWPECWVPDWAKLVDQNTRDIVQMAYLKKTYDMFKDHPAVRAWQVENEPHLSSFMSCPGMTPELVLKEMRYVKDVESARPTPRPVYTTDSGELSTWMHYPGKLDGLGVSVYRVVRNPILGIVHWFLPPWAYVRKAWIASLFSGSIYISEFQMEPWSNQPLDATSLAEQYQTMSIEQMRNNFTYAKELDMPAVDFWGVEWWLWMREKKGIPDFWNEARKFFQEK